MIIKSWFLNKNYSQNERYAINTADRCTIQRETEKAYLLKFHTEYGAITGWFPKSVCMAEVEDSPAPSTPFSVGDKVSHKTYGIGTISAINALTIDIDFEAGARKLGTQAAPAFIEKIA